MSDTQLIEFPESNDELRALLGATTQRRDAAAAAGRAVEAESLNNLAIRIDDEVRQRETAAREKQAAECDQLDRMFHDHPKPHFCGKVGWTGRNGY